jgi:hypothetical protein
MRVRSARSSRPPRLRGVAYSNLTCFAANIEYQQNLGSKLRERSVSSDGNASRGSRLG